MRDVFPQIPCVVFSHRLHGFHRFHAWYFLTDCTDFTDAMRGNFSQIARISQMLRGGCGIGFGCRGWLLRQNHESRPLFLAMV